VRPAGRILYLTILFLVVAPSNGFIISEFCPDPYLAEDPDEYIVISGEGNLDGLMIADGEGSFRFPPGSASHGKVTVVRQGAGFERGHGIRPDFEWYPSSPDIPDTLTFGAMRLANSRDELILYENGIVVQDVSWPQDIHPREGQVHYFQNGVWDQRVLLIGQTRLGHDFFPGVSGTAFVSPDCSRAVFKEALSTANHEILVNVYEFTDPEFADMLCTAKERGVNVTLLLEGGPVGGISREEQAVCYRMSRQGIGVYQMVTTDTVHAPYRFDHAKYIVIDRETVLLTSENFKGTGFPPEGIKGNRGWGIWLRDGNLARFFAGVFQTDLNGPWIRPLLGRPEKFEESYKEERPSRYKPMAFESATVIPVISPDSSDEIKFLLENATQSIEIEQAYITNGSPGVLNPYLLSAIEASRRGVSVRVLLDSYWYNIEEEADNDELAEYINRIARAENLPLSARCIDLESDDLLKIHNKGVIVDRSKVLISSINWNTNSPTFNREAGVIIEEPAVAQYYLTVFEDDWEVAEKTGVRVVDDLKIFVLIGIICVLAGIWVYKKR
jgi:hypothetical protein